MPRAKKPNLGSINPSAPAAPGGALPSTPTGLAYGEHTQLANAQAAVPVGGTPMPAPAAPGDMMAAAKSFTPPNVGLGDPSSRPGEHVLSEPTAPAGPGAGTLADMLTAAAQASGSTSLLALAQRAANLGQ